MPLIKVTNLAGESSEISAETGLSLMEALREAGYEEIQAICGGGCSCATCHVHLSAPAGQPLPVMEDDELSLLELADEYDPTLSRLSCQIELDEQHAGLEIQLVETD